MEIVVVLELAGGLASVRLPDDSIETWALASLPRDVQVGDRVGVTVTAGDLEMVILPRLAGFQA